MFIMLDVFRMKSKSEQAVEWAKERGVIRPKELAELGIHPTYIQHLVSTGEFRKVGRGLYVAATHEPTEAHTLVQAVKSQTGGVICLLSALMFHQLGTQAPYNVWLAVPYGTRHSTADYPPRRIIVMREPAYEAGIEYHDVEGMKLPVYSVAKTVADCFKFRNKVGLDVALEALREALRDRRCHRSEIHAFAKLLRVEKVIMPYLEALT